MTVREASAAPSAFRRLLALTRAADRAHKSRFGAQFAKFLAWIIGLGFGLAMVLVARGTGGALLEALVADALGWLSWVTAGIAALSSAGAAKDSTEQRALASLAEQRGFVAARAVDARGLAAMRRVFRLTVVPALCLALLALGLSGSLGVAGSRIVVCAAVIGYCAVLALLVGGLAHVAGVLAPHQPRALLLMFLFLPHMARAIWPHLPSVPWALGSLIDRIGAIGA